MRFVVRSTIATLFLCAGMPLGAQAAATTPVPPAAAARAADPRDVASLDAIVAALYASISGPKGAPREFDRLRTLFAPNARLMPTGLAPDGTPRLRSWTVEEYAAAAGPGLVANGFFEREIGRTTTSYGNVWHIMSAYDSRNTPDAPPFARGVNSIQLFKGADRWYVVTVFWDSERPGNPIPPELLERRATTLTTVALTLSRRGCTESRGAASAPGSASGPPP